MLRMYLVQAWFNLSDEGAEDAVYDSYALCKFVGVNFLSEQVSDVITLLHFQHLLEESQLGRAIIHVGVDAGTGAVVTTATTIAANVHDIAAASKLLREDDTVVLYGDSGYLGIEKRPEIPEIAEDEHLSKMDYRINRCPGKLHRMRDNNGQDWERFIEHCKSSVRSKVEHPFRFLKVQCGFRKTVYRGLEKNLNRVLVLFASSNLYSLARAGRMLAVDWACHGRGMPILRNDELHIAKMTS